MPNDDGFNGQDDGRSGDQEMHHERETFGEPPAKSSRRTRWITGAAAVAAVGIGVAVAKFACRASIGDDRTLNDLKTIVQGHFKQQAHGPNWRSTGISGSAPIPDRRGRREPPLRFLPP